MTPMSARTSSSNESMDHSPPEPVDHPEQTKMRIVMPTTCQQCGAVLSLPGRHCQNCGFPVERAGGADTTQVAPQIPQADDETKVESILQHIASQSHFEERYEIRSILDRGGMGCVYRGYDRILCREVAIKMTANGSDAARPRPAVRGQFLKEARIGGRLLHPNILAVFDLGVNRAGETYYTMRLVDGASLQQSLEALEKGVLTKFVGYPFRKIITAFVAACQGVDYAHQNRVIHLDLKPQNILVSGFSEVFVIDWGLARMDEVNDMEQLIDLYRERSNSGNTTANTFAAGPCIGTPAYISPEQARGDSNSFDPTTDVFGLGGILYFILYGNPPNQGRTNQERLEASFSPKHRSQLRQGILPRGQRVRRETQQAIEALESICLQALEIDQKKRYSDVERLIIDLNDWLSTASDSMERGST